MKAFSNNNTNRHFLKKIQEVNIRKADMKEVTPQLEEPVPWTEQDNTKSEGIKDNGAAPATISCTPFTSDNRAVCIAVARSHAIHHV